MILIVHVKPKAHETKVIAWLDEKTIVIAVHAGPVDNAANIELINFLSEKLYIAKSFIVLKSGRESRVKKIEIPDGTSLAWLRADES